MIKIIEDFLYAETHEWVKIISETKALIGLSDFAQHALGDLVFVNLPETGDTVTAGAPFGDVESVKAVSDIIAPVTGTVSAVNQEALDHPELINQDPYESWLIEVTDYEKAPDLMEAEAYEEFCQWEAQ
jgi:glycine cleavage system H protein